MIEKRYISGLLFERAAHFYKDDHNHLRVKVFERFKQQTHLIYAHYFDDKLLYIGESSVAFIKRMNCYCNHNGASNVRVREYVNSIFHGNHRDPDLCTFIHIPKKKLMINEELSINPYAAIEQELINIHKPVLNKKNVFRTKNNSNRRRYEYKPY